MCKKRKYRRYYNNLALINMVVFNIVIIIFGMTTFNAIYKSKSIEYLRQFDHTLNELVSTYTAKHDNFYYMLLPLYNDTERLIYLNQFLSDQSDTLINTDPWLAVNIINIMQDICERDRDAIAVYFFKSISGTMYSFNATTRAFTQMNQDSPFYDILSQKSGQRMISGSQTIETTISQSAAMKRNSELAFSIAGTLDSRASKSGQWSSVLVAYQLDSLKSKVDQATLNTGAHFGIITLSGQMIYDSTGQYAQTGYTLFPDLEQVLSDSDVMTIDGTKYLKNAFIDPVRGYAAFYYLPRAVLAENLAEASAPIVFLVIVFCCMSVLICFVVTRLTGKRIRQLENGMKEIGSHNLDYRIPVGSQNDELSLVAVRFNDMCDQLQDTINKVYLYNIKQKEAGFYALQTSINPHFLYNTLEAVRSKLSDQGQIDAAEMIVMLSRLFEYQIRGATFVTIGEEIEALELYINFFDLRYDSRFSFIQDIPGNILDYALPKYTLQPILENYFIHGIRPSDNNQIWLSGCLEGPDILITIEDDGMGISPEKLVEIRTKLASHSDGKSNFGLMNVHQRLQYAFDDSCGIVAIESPGEGQGTRITLRIKVMRVEDLKIMITKGSLL